VGAANGGTTRYEGAWKIRPLPSAEPHVAGFRHTQAGEAEFEISFDAADLAELDKAILFYVPFHRDSLLLTVHEDD
jgi:hypothetical protein